LNANDQNKIKSIDINNENIHTRTSPSLFSLKNKSTNELSSTSAVMPLTKISAQLTSKNNNRRGLKIKRRQNSSTSRKLKEPTRTGMTLRSRTIVFDNLHATERKDKKYIKNTMK
jgi:hypothetical protein